MRIIRGRLKGKTITPDKYFKARPTTGFAKENIFNVIENHIDLENIRALDLFSGTGSISYELASRGAAEVIAVENDYRHYLFIKYTAESLGLPEIKAVKQDVFKALRKIKGEKFELIFADPPYQLKNIDRLPQLLEENALLHPDTLVVIEHPKTVSFENTPFFKERRAYGSVNFSIFRIEKSQSSYPAEK